MEEVSCFIVLLIASASLIGRSSPFLGMLVASGRGLQDDPIISMSEALSASFFVFFFLSVTRGEKTAFFSFSSLFKVSEATAERHGASFVLLPLLGVYDLTNLGLKDQKMG
ncbi:hypothetical protein VTH06DRAFT_54 [Thermothelomyces fergusii]